MLPSNRVLLAAALAFLAGCSGGQRPAGSTATTGAQSTAPTPSAASALGAQRSAAPIPGSRAQRNIADAVSRRLANDVRVGAPLPAVRVEQGVVTLSGDVVDFRAERAADRDARRISGVRRVEDGMTVLPAHHQSDATIEQQALRGIYDDVAAPDSRDVTVMTTNARVTLKGVVASQEDRKVIEGDVEEVPGVVAVDDELRVKGYGSQTVVVQPESIRRRVVENIFWDPRVPTAEVVVNVAPGGDVTLGRQVDSWEEARAANDDAIRGGAAHVIDHIRIVDAPPGAGTAGERPMPAAPGYAR